MDEQTKQLKNELKKRLLTTFTERTKTNWVSMPLRSESKVFLCGAIPIRYNWICPKCGAKMTGYHSVGSLTEESYEAKDDGELPPELFYPKEFHVEAATALNTFLRYREEGNYKKLNLNGSCRTCQTIPAWSKTKNGPPTGILKLFIFFMAVMTTGTVVTSVRINRFDYAIILLGFLWVLFFGAIFYTSLQRKKSLSKYKEENFPQIAISEPALEVVFGRYYPEIQMY